MTVLTYKGRPVRPLPPDHPLYRQPPTIILGPRVERIAAARRARSADDESARVAREGDGGEREGREGE